MKEIIEMSKWTYTARDNGGKYQVITVTANSKPEAIEKGFQRAKRKAAGDITIWECRLKTA